MFPSLITALCKKANIPLRNEDEWADTDIMFHLLKVRGHSLLIQSRKRRADSSVGVNTSQGDDTGALTIQGPFESPGSQMKDLKKLIAGIFVPSSGAGPSGLAAGYCTREEIDQYMKTQRVMKTQVDTLQDVYATMAKDHGDHLLKLQVGLDKEKRRGKSRGKLAVRV
ncbi:uncharacterized protein LOC132047987 [Lycium ferocissimum]|uniref:uncharacterized protein LOC132047987 n=1 Tax=Lycium ferocissimum TaxID=112874 RepID=UPI002815599E|nr:uncharacterized protein LOC132047987 [Lycium ferocissimum]